MQKFVYDINLFMVNINLSLDVLEPISCSFFVEK